MCTIQIYRFNTLANIVEIASWHSDFQGTGSPKQRISWLYSSFPSFNLHGQLLHAGGSQRCMPWYEVAWHQQFEAVQEKAGWRRSTMWWRATEKTATISFKSKCSVARKKRRACNRVLYVKWQRQSFRASLCLNSQCGPSFFLHCRSWASYLRSDIRTTFAILAWSILSRYQICGSPQHKHFLVVILPPCLSNFRDKEIGEGDPASGQNWKSTTVLFSFSTLPADSRLERLPTTDFFEACGIFTIGPVLVTSNSPLIK